MEERERRKELKEGERKRESKERWRWTNMALLAVALDIAVLEITPHLEHFSSSRLRPSAGTLWKT